MRNYIRFAVYLVVVIGFSIARAGVYEDFFRSVMLDDARGVQALLQRGFDPNARDDKGQTPLYLSQREGSFKVAEVLLGNPQTRIDLPNAAGETALMMAALRGQAVWIERLMDRGARADGVVDGAAPGWTPLHYACAGPEVKAVQVLLARGARIDARSPNGTTPLMMAAKYGSEDAVEMLLKQGADARLRNDLNLSAGDFAQQAGRDALAVRLKALAP